MTPPAGVGTTPPAPPAGPVALPGIDQGPMRGELLRQIAQLEEELAVLLARRRDWSRRRISPRRGPALLSTADLERIRDELVTAVHDLPHGTPQPPA